MPPFLIFIYFFLGNKCISGWFVWLFELLFGVDAFIPIAELNDPSNYLSPTDEKRPIHDTVIFLILPL